MLDNPAPDPVHDIRVSIRRLNAAIALVEKIGGLLRGNIRIQLKKLMSPLGKLRDAQIKMEWIRYFSGVPDQAVSQILKSLQNEESGLIAETTGNIKDFPIDIIGNFSPTDMIDDAEKRIAQASSTFAEHCDEELQNLLSGFAKSVNRFNRSGKIRDLHRARIALKKFRYTVEIFLPLFSNFDYELLQYFQTAIGDTHDVEILLQHLKLAGGGKKNAESESITALKTEIDAFFNSQLAEIKKKLKGDGRLTDKWRRQMNKSKASKKKSKLEIVKPEIISLCERFDPDPPHAAHVAGLALVIFDNLEKIGLMNLGKQYRTLFEFGCLLHDIGWVDGQRTHHKRSFEIICNSELPVSKENKNIIALVARFHRKADPEAQPAYLKLTKKERGIVLKLAAMIRIADVLDRSHDGKAKILKIESMQDCLLIGVSKGTLSSIPETAMAKKTALFQKAFGIRAIISEEGA